MVKQASGDSYPVSMMSVFHLLSLTISDVISFSISDVILTNKRFLDDPVDLFLDCQYNDRIIVPCTKVLGDHTVGYLSLVD